MRTGGEFLLGLAMLFIVAVSAAGQQEQDRWAGDAAKTPLTRPAAVVYTKANAPSAPKLEELPLKESISQYGITWTFEKPARVGQFVTGDYYVVGPVVVKEVSPRPLFGGEVTDPTGEEQRRFKDRYARNGSVLNLTATGLPGFDSRTQGGRYNPDAFVRFPVELKPGDALISTISLPDATVRNRMLGPSDHRSVTAVYTASVLTCVEKPLPPDAFRPGYCDRMHRKTYLARNLKREMLLSLKPPASAPNPEMFARVFERPWIDTVFFGFCAPAQNMPQYGREVARAAGMGSLLLLCDYPAQRKEALLQGMVQAGIDLWSIIEAGGPGWEAFGGHGSGRKWTIVFAGMLLGDEDMVNPYRKYPNVKFGEDMQTVYGNGWTGAKALYAGHRGIDGEKYSPGWGLFEHLPPEQWKAQLGEGYRHCCTSISWVGEALAIRLLKAEKVWNYDAFLDYCDRWMYEDNTEFLKKIQEAKGWTYGPQGSVWDAFVNDMWKMYRTSPGMPPTDGWKRIPAGVVPAEKRI